MANNAQDTPQDQINIQNIDTVDPLTSIDNAPSVNELAPLSRVGADLSKFILWIISGFVAFLAIFLIFNHPDASSQITIPTQANIPDSSFSHKLALIKAIQEEKKSYRDFIVQISQMVLLNLLLPTLTAILGYIFGSKGESRP